MALGLSLGVLVMSGVMAAILFPMMKRLALTLPDVAILQADHWKIAAGYPAATIFDVTTVTLGVLLIAAGAASLRMAGARWIKRGLLVTATVYIGFAAFVFLPMSKALKQYRGFALAGDELAAIEAQTEFQRLHMASTALMLLLALCYVTCLLSLWLDERTRRLAKA